MPLSDDCIPGEQCCDTLFRVSDYLLNESYQALLACYSGPCEISSIARYVTLGRGDDAVPDALTVAFTTSIVPAKSDQRLSLWRATFELRLRQSGWPMAHTDSTGQVVFGPEWQSQTAKARQAYGHGEKMYRHLIWLNNSRQLPPPSFNCSNAQIGALTPMNPSGGVVGWLVPITMDVPWGGG